MDRGMQPGSDEKARGPIAADPPNRPAGLPDQRTSARKVLIFIDRWDADATSEHIEAVADAFPAWEFHILQKISESPLPTYVRLKLRQLVRSPFSFSMKAISHFARMMRRPRQPLANSIRPPAICAQIRKPNVHYRSFGKIDSPEALEYARSLRPWLGLSIGAPILKRSMFAIPELGTINIHKSLLPHYRGMPYGFWELHDGATTSGVSIHRVDDELDAGPILHARPYEIPPYSTVGGLAVELDRLGTETLIEALRTIEVKGRAYQDDLRPHDIGSPPNRPPGWFKARQVRKRLWKRRRDAGGAPSTARRLAKGVCCLVYVRVFAAARNLLLGRVGRCRTSILVYHRVSDHYLDFVTVGVEQFERQIDHLSRHYDIIDMPEFLADRGKPRSRPALVITFDDGYADNFAAAMILRRAKVPATFFISTQIVGTDRAFPHDLQVVGHGIPSLGWNEVRQIRDWGFQIANHTRSHADLGRVSIGEALSEISGASDDLDRELGPVPGKAWLAYPSGRPTNLSDEVRDRLPSMGIRYCFSAYGGTNRPDFDEFDILRQGVDHRFDLLRLRAAVEGWSA